MIMAMSLSAAPAELLQQDDVKKIMQQILYQHLDQQAMTKKVLKNSFEVYIDQFDPVRIYLLDEEVDPYLNLTDAQIQTLMDQYRKDDFSAYTTLNTVIQKAVLRARQYRKTLETNENALFQEEAPEPINEERPFARAESQLQRRVEDHILQFIISEEENFGVKKILEHKQAVLANYEDFIREYEDQYLYQEEDGTPIPLAKQENLFTMHVLKALAKSLDSHTSFYDAEEAYDMKIRLEKGFYGIGIIPESTTHGVFVSRILEGSPAAKQAAIKPGDQILSVDGTSTKTLPVKEITERFLSTKGTRVSLTLKRDNTPFKVTLKSDLIVVNEDRMDVLSQPYQGGVIGVIALHSFYKGKGGITSEKDVRDAILDLNKDNKLKGLVLDLRNNSGGFLTEAVKVAGLFITNGVVVISKYNDGEEHFYRDMDSRVYFDGPLIVLTSKGTASAAEIVAQALQDYGIAVIVGDEHTYGKGTIQSQTVTNNRGSSYFKVTVGTYYTVSGKTPQLNGVKSDIVVPSDLLYRSVGEEYLENAIDSQKTIADAYSDDLADIDPGLKPWFLRYYTPTLQGRTANWQQILPKLRQNSKYRMARDPSYQKFFNGGSVTLSSEDNDPQLQEALHIVKDMVQLQPKKK